MSEREALIRAVIANPDEDTARVVFADWLDEHGDALDRQRATLCRYARPMLFASAPGEGWQFEPDGSSVTPPWVVADALAVLAATVPWTGNTRLKFRRGFVESWFPAKWEQFIYAAEVFNGHPITACHPLWSRPAGWRDLPERGVRDEGASWWGRSRPTQRPLSYELPPEVWGRMAAHHPKLTLPHSGLIQFPSPLAAKRALERVSLELGRAMAAEARAKEGVAT